MTRTGKIARLPHDIRTELNSRLQDGEQAKTLLEWLNTEPRVQETLKEKFGGRPVNEQNLSEWKQGGYQDWLRHEESRALVERLTEQCDDLDEAAGEQEISDRFAGVLAAEMARLAMTLMENEADPEKRWQRLREVHRELSQLRRDDHRAMRTVIERNRWNRQVDREDEEAAKREAEEGKKRLIDLCLSGMHNGVMAEAFGGGEYGKKMATILHHIKFDLPLPDLKIPDPPDKAASDAVNPGQAQSS
jgi:hypothetical protein